VLFRSVATLWQAHQPLNQDYQILYKFTHRKYHEEDYYWLQPISPHKYGAYPMSLWDVGELVQDNLTLQIAPNEYLGSGRYHLDVYILDTINNRFLPVTVNGDYVGEFYRLEGEYRYR